MVENANRPTAWKENWFNTGEAGADQSPTAVGKKNWLFMGEAGAGQRGAIIYTLIETCRKRSIDPYAYLRDILTRLPTMKNKQIAEVIQSFPLHGPEHYNNLRLKNRSLQLRS